MRSDNKIYWTDMHSNLHHEKMMNLETWVQHIKQLMDFWPIAYYPYYMRPLPSGWLVEDLHDMDKIIKDWEMIRNVTNQANAEGFPMFMGYEWQGSGGDGDHNVFFKDNQQDPVFPLRYETLFELNQGKNTIAIPHHLAYQLGNRGKNWQTHHDDFSPFVEIYSSHGSSENDTDSIPMDRHIHMGTRTGQTSVSKGWEAGHRFGVIASGDNHSVPGAYEFGSMACLATECTKEALWSAMINKRVYGVSKDRIKLDFQIDKNQMGSEISPKKNNDLFIEVEGSNRIDRVEIIADNRVIDVVPMLSKIHKYKSSDLIKCKFKLEFGWGPDRRIFPDIAKKEWIGKLKINGKVISIEKCWNNFGQKLENVTDHGFDFTLTSYKNAANDKWMANSAMMTEGFIIEIEDKYEESIALEVNGKQFNLKLKDILNSSQVIDFFDESFDLIKSKYDFSEYYRNDSWWHNSYKMKVGQASPYEEYHMVIEQQINLLNFDHVRVRVWQNNGSVAWSSPIFIRRGKI